MLRVACNVDTPACLLHFIPHLPRQPSPAPGRYSTIPLSVQLAPSSLPPPQQPPPQTYMSSHPPSSSIPSCNIPIIRSISNSSAPATQLVQTQSTPFLSVPSTHRQHPNPPPVKHTSPCPLKKLILQLPQTPHPLGSPSSHSPNALKFSSLHRQLFFTSTPPPSHTPPSPSQ